MDAMNWPGKRIKTDEDSGNSSATWSNS